MGDRSPPWSATLSRWWGFTPMTRKISKIWRRGANQELTKPVRTDLLHITSAFVLVSASQLTTALQPSFYGFTAVYLRLHSRLRLYSSYLLPCGYIRGCALGRTDTASGLGRCKSLPTPEVR